MQKFNETDTNMLNQYIRPVVHMRQQFKNGRFSLVFGTGLTQQVGIPSWNELNDKIAAHPDLNGLDLLGRPTKERVDEFLETESRETVVSLVMGAGPEETITTQKLYEHFKRKEYSKKDPQEHYTPKVDADIYRKWKDIIRDILYNGADSEEQILNNHSYLNYFIPVIKNTPLTITYNFDDVIEMAISNYHIKRTEGRGYETVTNLSVLPIRKTAVIYHPNGYIPRNRLEEKDIDIVLSENEFATRMLELSTGQYNSMLHVLSRNTSLFVGLSLKDSILKNLLKQSAMVAPGNYHYYIHYCNRDEKPSFDEQESIRNTNFETYNLITLFLNNDEIGSLGKLISNGYNEKEQTHSDKGIKSLADITNGTLSFCFYIIGAVGVGKSSCVAQFRNLITFDEWFEDRKPELGIDWNEIERMEATEKAKIKKDVDEWIAEQFYEKNRELIEHEVGIAICDRCPLDPILFTPINERKEKAAFLLEKVCPGSDKIKKGHIILLWDDPEKLDIRAAISHRGYKKESLEKMQMDLFEVYKMSGVTSIDCRFISFYDVVKNISRIIHMKNYDPSDIYERLTNIKNGVGSIKC